MKKIILLACISLMIASCGIFQKSHKDKEVLKTESLLRVKKDSTIILMDKSIITTKEKIDTTVIIPERKVTQASYLNMDSLVIGITAIKSDLVDVRFTLDPITRILTANALIKQQLVPVTMSRETSTHKDLTLKKEKKEEAVNINKSSEEHLLIEKKSDFSLWWVILSIAILIACIVAFRRR